MSFNKSTAIESTLQSNREFEIFVESIFGSDEVLEWRAIGSKNVKRLTGSGSDLFGSLCDLNDKGFEIFVTINQTDGKDIKSTNVTRVRALFADFDKSPLSNLDRIKVKPSLIVNTSPEKYHAYWLVDDCPLEQFKPMQQQLAQILESDPAVCDLPRIMRVPGFHHLKGAPFMVTTNCPEELHRYSFVQMKEAMSGLSSKRQTHVGYSLQKGCNEGSRNTALTSLAGRLIYDSVPDQEAVRKLIDWNILNIPPLPEEEIISTYHRIRAKDEIEHGDSRRTLKQLNDKHAVVMIGGKTVIVREGKTPTFMSYADFCLRHANLKIGTKAATKIWIQSDQTKRYDDLVFDPSERCPESSYNLFKGLSVKPHIGCCDRYLQHIREIICSGDQAVYEYVLNWMAHIIQKPTELPGVALVLQGAQGTGKGTFVNHFGKLFGDHFKHLVHMDHLLGKFTSHLSSALLVFADEIVWGGNKREAGQLKGIITESRRMMEAKFKDPVLVDNYARFIFATNEDWAVPTGPKERRFCVLNVDDSRIQDLEYFGAINNEMRNGGHEALMYHLRDRDLRNFNIRSYPVTEGLLKQKVLSLPSVAQWWYDILADGQLEVPTYRFREEVVWEKSVSTRELFKLYREFAQGDRYGHGQVVSCQQFVTLLQSWAPVVKHRATDGGIRTRCLRIPSLESCRQHFQSVMGQQIDWDGQ